MALSGRDDWDRHWQEFNETAEQNPAQNYRRELILAMLGISGSGQGARILDVGSGQGDMAAAIRARFPSAEILGLELSKSGVEISRRKLPAARFVQRDLRTLDVLALDPPYLRGADSNSLLRLYDAARGLAHDSPSLRERAGADRAVQRIARELGRRKVPL